MGILEMVSETDKAWLAGIIDGEGMVLIYRGGNKRSIPVFRLLLVNSSFDMMVEARRIMSELSGREVKLKPKYYNQKIYNEAKIKANLPMWVIELNRQSSVLIILTNIVPYMVAKKERANMSIYWLNHHKKYDRWLDHELDAIFQKPVETKSKALVVEQDEAIVRACEKSQEIGRNDQSPLIAE